MTRERGEDSSSEQAAMAKSLIDASCDAFVVLGFDGKIQYASHGTSTLAGIPAEELVGGDPLSLIDPEWADELVVDIAASLSGEDLTGRVAVTEIRRSDGTSMVVELMLHQPSDPADGALLVQLHPVPDELLMDEFLASMAEGKHLEEVLDPVMRLACDLSGAMGCTIHWDWDGAAFDHTLSVGVEPAAFDGHGGPWAMAAEHGEVIEIRSLRDLDAVPGLDLAGRGVEAIWSFPIAADAGETAVLSIWRAREGRITSTSRLSLTRILRMATLAFAHHRTEQRLRHAAHHDPLTGAPNRLVLDARLSELAETPDAVAAVLIVDLDGFKAVNDEHGHPVGDRVLVAVVDRIQTVLRPGDLLARLGGDEFAVVCPGVADRDQAAAITNRVLGTISEPFDIEGQIIAIGASVGICMSNPDHDGDALVDADAALLAAKRGGKGHFRIASQTAARRVDVDSEAIPAAFI